MPRSKLSDLETILGYWEDFGPREKRALAIIARRMYWGQGEYGALKYRKKNWQEEAFQEAADMSVYLAALLVDLEDEEDMAMCIVDPSLEPV